MSIHINLVGQYSSSTSPSSILSLVRKNVALMSFVLFKLDRGPLLKTCMYDYLSLCRILCSTVYPCTSMKYLVHSAYKRILSVPTIYVSVELLVLFCCPLQILFIAPFPRVSAPPVCPLQFLCIWGDASIHQFSVLNLSTSSVSFMCFVPLRYSSTLNSFPQSSLSVFYSLVVS